MTVIPRYRRHAGPAILAAGFRPFFLGASIWATLAIPLWLAAYAGGLIVPSLLAPVIWHVNEMIFGFAAGTIAGFLLAAIPNWTFYPMLPQTAALHALTVGALGAMTLAVMARASPGHTGRPLMAGPGTRAIYVLITLAALLRVSSPLVSDQVILVLTLAGAAWSSAFGLFAIL